VTIAAWVPRAHVFGQKWLYDLSKTGQKLVIWQISVLRGSGLPVIPSIDARIQVTKAFDKRSDLPDRYTKELWDQHHGGKYKGKIVKKANSSGKGWKPTKKIDTYVFLADHTTSYYLPWYNARDLFRFPEFVELFPSL
jgi:hypothetical protein